MNSSKWVKEYPPGRQLGSGPRCSEYAEDKEKKEDHTDMPYSQFPIIFH
jgi:hypothetical protein